jgi:hypothetical protein
MSLNTIKVLENKQYSVQNKNKEFLFMGEKKFCSKENAVSRCVISHEGLFFRAKRGKCDEFISVERGIFKTRIRVQLLAGGHTT